MAEEKRQLSPEAQARIDLREADMNTLMLLRKVLQNDLERFHLDDEGAEGNETYKNKGAMKYIRELLGNLKK